MTKWCAFQTSASHPDQTEFGYFSKFFMTPTPSKDLLVRPVLRRTAGHPATRLPEWVGFSGQERHLVPRGRTVVVAVSGGMDSMVLLEVMRRLAPEQGWRLVVAHFNHRLRGRASQADEQFVRRTAARAGLPVEVGTGEVRAAARRGKVSVEMAARQQRHEFLAAVARRYGARYVTMGHHADDQVELFLLRWLRGAGGEGLAGMKWRSRSPANRRVWLVRPLLRATRKDLESFARQAGLAWRRDASNASLDILRNRLRHKVLPQLRHCQPALAAVTGRVMDIIGAEAELASELARRWQRAKPREPFDRLPVAVQRSYLRDALIRRGVPPDFETVEWLRLNSETPVTVSGGQQWMRSKEGELVAVKTERPFYSRQRRAILLEGEGEWHKVRFGGKQLQWRVFNIKGGGWPAFAGGVEYFDAEKVGAKMLLRLWQAGDRYRPCGSRHEVKLQDVFVNAKVPAARRRRLVVAVTAEGRIFWVEGMRIGEACKLRRNTRNVLAIRWK